MKAKRWAIRPRRFNTHVQVFLCAIFISIAAAPAQETNTLRIKAPLRAEINHDESLPSLPDQYQVGNQFDEAKLQNLTPDNIWFPIPNWLAGGWHSETKTVDYVQDCKTGASTSPHTVVKEVSDAIHGHQRDKTGQIWEFIEIPHMRKVELTHGVAYLRALREEVIETDPSQVILKVLTNQITVDGKKQEIAASNQVQQIGTYIPLDDGLVQLDASVRNFDGDGAAIQMQRNALLMKRSKPYSDMDTLHGLDLKKLFAEFLNKTGRQDLVPKQP